MGVEDAADVPCAIVVTAVFERTVQKYERRGYRLAVIESGHIMQNLILVGAGTGLRALVSASFYEDELESLIMVDGVTEAVIATVLLAGGDND